MFYLYIVLLHNVMQERGKRLHHINSYAHERQAFVYQTSRRVSEILSSHYSVRININ